MLIRLPLFYAGLTSSPSRPTKKIKMAEEKNIASNSRPIQSKFPKNVGTPSNLRRSLHRSAYQFDSSNTFNDPIEVEEVEDPSHSNLQESAFGEKALSEEDSKDSSSAPGLETKTIEDSLDDRAIAVGEG